MNFYFIVSQNLGEKSTDCSSDSTNEAANLCIFYVIQFDPDLDHRVDLSLCRAPDHDRRPRLASHDVHDASDYDLDSVYETQKNAYRNCGLRSDAFALSVCVRSETKSILLFKWMYLHVKQTKKICGNYLLSTEFQRHFSDLIFSILSLLLHLLDSQLLGFLVCFI